MRKTLDIYDGSLPNLSPLPPAVHTVRMYIERKGIQPGDRFHVDEKLAQELGISLAAVRHAMRTLHQMGVVNRRRKTGTFLRQPDPGHLAAQVKFHVDLGNYTHDEIRRARAIFEQGVAAEAARRRTARDLLTMEVALDAMEVAEGNLQAQAAADQDFHQAVLNSAHNKFALIFNRVIIQSFANVPEALQATRGEAFRLTFAEHRQIYESISRQEPEKAGKLMYRSIADPVRQRLQRSRSNRSKARRRPAEGLVTTFRQSGRAKVSGEERPATTGASHPETDSPHRPSPTERITR